MRVKFFPHEPNRGDSFPPSQTGRNLRPLPPLWTPLTTTKKKKKKIPAAVKFLSLRVRLSEELHSAVAQQTHCCNKETCKEML